ncbi:hypothetical protein Q673_08765 [Marinobacter sp. EN3]|jgi:hypothetical protein|uniref:hypothetical protein n=1 Tax=Marinobacter sp. EN3 TaxID=1397533 RepID=UPI0003B8F1F5|nr:hypothetical protein [Marinobacter sp. EN3]ERS01215.1 hypothetical protein Q673_08765 [Marinobacter sp. EN3]
MTTNRRPMLALSASLALLSGCSSFGPVTSGTDNPCATLQAIVKDYSTGFERYRGSGSSYSMVTLYRAKEQLIKGHCEIWEWGNGDAAYTCTVGAPNQPVAEARFNEASNLLAQCLGPDWTRETKPRERDGKPAGEAVALQTNDPTAPSVSLHRVEDGSRQSLYLFVGPSSRSPSDK